MRYFLVLSYEGTAFHGWQRQPATRTVQGEVERALSTLLRCPTEVVGAGRTDTGVHAAYYVAHFDGCVSAEPAQWLYRLNALLPEDVAVHRVCPVGELAHARYDARSRTYVYRIATGKNPFSRRVAWYYSVPLDVEAMNRAAAALTAERDFATFCKLDSGNRTTLCTVYEARWERTAEGLRFTITADRFLRNMVRAVVAALVDVGRGRIDAAEFERILRLHDLKAARGTAPACGLSLGDVGYPEEVFPRSVRDR